jgi:hypothetical protein
MASPNQHYEMSRDTKFPLDITTDLGDNLDDPARVVHWPFQVNIFNYLTRSYVFLGVS